MNAWERFGRQRLARSRWNSEPAALNAADSEAFEQAWQRQRQMELAIVTLAPAHDIAPELRDSVAASLGVWLSDAALPPRSARPSCCITPAWRSPLPNWRSRCRSRIRQRCRPGIFTIRAHFMRPEQRLTRHLLLTVRWRPRGGSSANPRAASANKRLPRCLCAAGAALFQCPSALEGGRLGWISRGLLYPQLETALFSLTENALSPPVASELGWHLLWCEAIRPAVPMEQQQALESARDYLWQQSQQRHQRRWLQDSISRQPGLCG
ncbi:peptidyl-prolyl cis-trans isomerase SurA [Raoultella terrigena]|uniref:Peptidyl-prolyl cis-trans isomerase SurA n=1 Tax=Raoultella terrigena TaxID=577 RepID=A0A4U9D0W5_RAOTE|nr:peptidyl-prolyl cis-trans isomerase SurA [Raoultella terrigena]